jgi:hypothetical protein
VPPVAAPVVPPVALPGACGDGAPGSVPWWPVFDASPVVPTSMPRVGAPSPNGPTQIFVVAPPASTASAGSGPPTGVEAPTPRTGSGVPIVVQVHPPGQSLFAAQVADFGEHQPGNAATVGHSGAPASNEGGGDVGSAGADAPTLDELPQLDTFGWQTNPSPQSVSALQGSCHLNAQMLRVVVVQVSVVVTTTAASHCVFAAHPETDPPPPVQAVDFWA